MIKLTDNAREASQATHVRPNLIFEIEGLSARFSSVDVQKFIKIGDPGLVIGDDWKIGGFTGDPSVKPYVSFSLGGQTTSKIQQQLSPDRSQGSTITSLTVSILDKSEEISELISPGFELADILGVNAIVYLGFTGTAFPEDYVVLFRGIVQGIQTPPGVVHFLLANTEAKKKAASFTPRTSPLNGSIGTTGLSFLTVEDASVFALPVLGPSGDADEGIDYLVRLDDELFTYTGTDFIHLTGVTRAALNTIVAEHADDTDVQSVYRLRGNGMDLALKVMLSGWNGPFVEDIPIKNFNEVTPLVYVENGLLIPDLNAEELYGLTIGDYCTITGATDPANNITALQIGDIQYLEDYGTVLTFGDAAFVDETSSSAVASFRSQYDTLGQGLKLKPSEVDVAEHQRLKTLFVGSFEFDFLVDNIPNTKDWIEKELYLPMACFSVPRKARSSVAVHIGPIGGDFIPVLDVSNVTNADKLKLERSTASNFANTIQYSYDWDYIAGAFKTIKSYESLESKARIPIGDIVTPIKSEGLKSADGAANQSDIAAEKLLNRYQFGAQFYKGLEVLWRIGYPMEIGDIVAVNLGSLKQTDFSTGNRSGGIKLFEIINKSMDIVKGIISIDIVDTNFGTDQRFGLISPSSYVGPGATKQQIPLKRSFGTLGYQSEGTKWQEFIGEEIQIVSPDWTTYVNVTTIVGVDKSVDPAVMLVSPALASAPDEDFLIVPPPYPDSEDVNVRINWKTGYLFFSPTVAVVASADQTHFEVDPSNTGDFKVGAIVQVHNQDFSEDSGELKVLSVDILTNIIELDNATGFTITSDHLVDYIGFPDGQSAYRWV